MADNATSNPGSGDGGGKSYNQTLPQFMDSTNTLLINALLPVVWDKLQNRGYTQQDIMARQDELTALRKLDEAQRQEYGEQYEATARYERAKTALHLDYMDHLGLARIALKNDLAAQTALGLRGKRKESQSGYITQGLLFYNNILDNITWSEQMAGKGISESTLRDMQQRFANLGALTATQKEETGEAQEATKKRDKAYDALYDWVADFRATAKIVLRPYPQLREQLGIKETS